MVASGGREDWTRPLSKGCVTKKREEHVSLECPFSLGIQALI